MKKILILAVISVFFIIPSLASAKYVMTDTEMGSLIAQAGSGGTIADGDYVLLNGTPVGTNAICKGDRCSFTVTFSDVRVRGQQLRTISTDGWNYWSDAQHGMPDYSYRNDPNSLEGRRNLGYFDPDSNTRVGYFDGTDETNPQKNPGFGIYTSPGYFGYTMYTTSGLVKRSGSIVTEISKDLPVIAPGDPDPYYWNLSMKMKFNDQTIDTGSMGIYATLKLSTSPTLDGDQILGHTYTAGVSMTNSGYLSVYAFRGHVLWP